MRFAVILLAWLLLGQTTGGPGSGNNLEVGNIADRWEFEGVPASALTGPPGQLPFAEPGFCEIPAANGQVVQRCFDPTADEGLIMTWKVPPNYKEGSDFRFFVDWAPTTAATGDVKWDIVCSGPINHGSVWPATTAITALAAAPGVAEQQTNTLIGTFSGSSTTVRGAFSCSVFRDADDPPGGTDDYPDDVAFAGFIVSYQTESVGTTTEFTK